MRLYRRVNLIISLLSGEPLIHESASGDEPSHMAALREYLRALDLKEPTEAIRTAKLEISRQIQEWEQQQQHGPTIDNWHDGLEDPSVLEEWQNVKPVSMEELSQAWRRQEQDGQYDGTRNGATIEDLAAAWAQAEAEYDDDMANNMAGGYDNGDAGQLQPYEFAAPLTEEQRALPAQNYLEEGLALFDRGETTRAIQSLETSIQIDPDSAKAWLYLGKAHAEHDEDRKAIACLERAVETDPYATDALLALGVSYVNELNHAKALHNLKEWITHNPNYAGLSTENDLYGGGSSESELDQVQALLVTALEVDPTLPEIHEALGVVYSVSREYDAAVASFQTALQSRPNSYSLWNKLGATLANSNQSAEALPNYHEALQLRPKYARAWLNMAISHSNLQHYDEAARCYLQTISLNPAATHCWSYVRIALSCLERWDLLPLVAEQNVKAFQEHFDFVLYD
jgi:peroxin-5